MKVEPSKKLSMAKPLLKKLLNLCLENYEYASILGTDVRCKIYSVANSGINVEEDELLSSSGYVVRVFHKGSYAEYSFNEISEDTLQAIFSEIKNRLIPLAGKVVTTECLSQYKQMEDSIKILKESTEFKIDPDTMGDGKIIEKMSDLRKKGMVVDQRIVDCIIQVSFQKNMRIFLSRNKDLMQNTMSSNGFLIFCAMKGQEMKQYFRSYSMLGGMELLEDMEDEVSDAAKVMLELLDSEPMIPGTYDCICAPDVTGVIAHEAFGHGVEMDMFVKDRALAKKYMGQRVASDLVTMHDGAAAALESATYYFDDEGNLSGDTIIIDHGILKAGLSDALTAQMLSSKPTGNGRRESFERKAYARMTNTFFEGGEDKVEDMIASITDGFLLESVMGGMEDPKNWGIQCICNIAREIKNGKLTGKIYSPVMMTGYVPELLQSISMMSEEISLNSGLCGKGYKEWIMVSYGGPYIKARIRLG